MSGSLQVAAVVSVVVLAASMVSVELGISIAVIEILLGVVVGNLLHLLAPEWMVFLAGFGSILLTFLAGAEVDPDVLAAASRPCSYGPTAGPSPSSGVSVLLVVLMWLGELAHSHAVLPAFLLGLALARTFARSHQAAALAGRIGGRPIAQ